MSWDKFIFSSDLHGDMADAGAVGAFHEFCKVWDPKKKAIRVFGGDLFDFRAIRKGASQEEKSESMRSDVEAGMMFLERYRPKHYLRGNHCERLWELAETTGVQADYAQYACMDIESKCKRLKINMLPYHKRHGILKIGHLKMLHGFASGVNAARVTGIVYRSCLFGHIHAILEHSIPDLDHCVARSVGCLCQLDMPYNARHVNTLRQAHGWAYGLINSKTGSYKVWQAERTDDSWLLPTDTMEIKQPG